MSIRVFSDILRQKINIKKYDHDGTRTHNLPVRSRTPYPLGHAAGLLRAHISVHKSFYSQFLLRHNAIWF